MAANFSAFPLHRSQFIRSFVAALAFALAFSGCGGGSTPAPETPSSIAITPATASVAKGQTTNFTAIGTYSNTTANITDRVTWTSTNTAAATINSTTGVANAVNLGSTTVFATLNGISSPAVPFTVTPAVVTGISISPSASSSPKGTPVTFTATGTYSDGTTGNISGSVTWTSSNTAVATLNGSGIASTLAQGSSTITASINGVSSNSATLTVTAPALTAIDITPGSASVAKGLSTNFTATGTYTDATMADVSSQVAWVSADPAVAAINSATGVATGVALGSTTVTASASGIVSPAASLSVTVAIITGISISPSTISTPKGTPVTFTATGTYSDGTTGNISGSVTWTSSNTAVATLNGSGIASTLAQGNSTISASINGVSSNSATLTVNAPVLATLTITPSSASVMVGNTQQFAASGTMSDGSAATLGALTWVSSDISVAAINSTGLASALATGSTNINANYGDIVSNTAVVIAVPLPPAAPIGVFAVSDTNQATVSWPPVAGATSYNIYWGTSSGVTTASTKISDATSLYVHTGLTAGNTYYYRVSAANAGGETLSAEFSTLVYAGGNPASSFSATGNIMSAARIYHTATLLPNGKVLITGGYNAAGGYLNSAELYNPATGLFEGTGSMTTSRANHTATLLPNGKVLIAGGCTATGALASAELYDPATGLFGSAHGMMGSLVTARCKHTATLLANGRVLFAGGYEASYLASAELFNPAFNYFSSTGNMISAGISRTATLLPDGKVLITGGENGSTDTGFLSSAEIYDPATSIFSSTSNSMSAARTSHTATRLPNGKILVAGGATIGMIYLANAELYDPATGLFDAARGSMNMARGHHAATPLPNGKVLLTGGINATGYLASAELYDPALDSFSATGTMAAARDLHAATLLPNGKVLVTGGGNGSYLSSAELFQ